MELRHVALADLSIRGERALRTVALYGALKRRLMVDKVGFRVPVVGSAHAHADRVLFLNLTYWQGGANSDVLVDDTIDADVLAHAGWHHAASRALATGRAPTAAALFLGESVASAFDLYLVGRLLQTQRRADYLTTQVPAMTAAALGAGLTEEALGALLGSVAEDPDRAFEDLRQLLFDAALALCACETLDDAVLTLDTFRDRRFVSLLHHYAVSAWVLYARAYAGPAVHDDPALAADRAVRAAPVALDWLQTNWLG